MIANGIRDLQRMLNVYFKNDGRHESVSTGNLNLEWNHMPNFKFNFAKLSHCELLSSNSHISWWRIDIRYDKQQLQFGTNSLLSTHVRLKIGSSGFCIVCSLWQGKSFVYELRITSFMLHVFLILPGCCNIYILYIVRIPMTPVNKSQKALTVILMSRQYNVEREISEYVV